MTQTGSSTVVFLVVLAVRLFLLTSPHVEASSVQKRPTVQQVANFYGYLKCCVALTVRGETDVVSCKLIDGVNKCVNFDFAGLEKQSDFCIQLQAKTCS